MTEFDPAVKRLAAWSIAVAFGVMALKLVAWHLTGSVALLSDGLESTVNVVAAVVAYAAITYAQKPADADHQFGHHKAEYFSAVLEGVLIAIAAMLIIQQAIPALRDPQPIDAPGAGLADGLLRAHALGAVLVGGVDEHQAVVDHHVDPALAQQSHRLGESLHRLDPGAGVAGDLGPVAGGALGCGPAP